MPSQDIKVVVVDDDEDIRFTFQMMVRGIDGVTFVGASDMDGAMRAISGGADVVFADLACGDTCGLDVVRECRGKLGGDAVIYLMSGTADESTAASARAAGADGFIRKPFNIIEIARIVEAAQVKPSCAVQQARPS